MGCNSNSPVAPPQTVSFGRDVFPIFQQSCALSGCHLHHYMNSDNLDLSSWRSFMIEGYSHGAPIVPYNSFWSGLVSHINSDTNLSITATPKMPLNRPGTTDGSLLSPGSIHTILQWINEGAKDDYGNVAFSNIPNKAFITNQGADYVAVVNTDNNYLVRLVPVGTHHGGYVLSVPHHVSVDNHGKYFYPALINDGAIEKYDAMTYERVGRLVLGSSPAEVFLMNSGSKGYVTNWDATGLDRSIKIINTDNMSFISEVSDTRMNATHGGRVTRDDKYFIGLSQLSEYIIFVDTKTDQVIDEIPVADDVPPNGNGTTHHLPYGIALSRDNKYGFITCPPENVVRVIDLDTRTIIKVIPVGHYPVMIEVSPDNKWCYVPNRNSNSVSVIDVATMTVAYTIENVGVQPHGVDFTIDGHYAYVTNESQNPNNPYIHHPITQNIRPGTTAVIDVWAGHQKIDNIEMASFPNGIAITPRN